MRKEFLMDTIGQAKDTYVMEAGMEVKAKRTGKRFWKVLAAAALIPVLVLTAYATDFLNIKSLLSGPERFQSSSYSQMGRAMLARNNSEKWDKSWWCVRHKCGIGQLRTLL